jgi:hypothetical protein
VRSLFCQQLRVHRSLQPRWPHRRFHCRHDLHLLKRVYRADCLQVTGRARRRPALAHSPRRPNSA